MTLKEELEILRGEPIQVLDGDPMDIPCIETSDPDKLCKHPVVSVRMITYNHEPYIRQAIEGVMMQKTDFEFELIIGEDCSQDKTREICFEYQKKYPDKIRVLWWHENVSKLGGNGRRVSARCRGEFIAFCEGDDYWIDPLKLQKQVDVMRNNHNVGLCFTNGTLYSQCNGSSREWDWERIVPHGMIEGRRFLFFNIYSHSPYERLRRESYLLTASVMVRVEMLKEARQRYEILSWKLRLGDVPLWLALASCHDVYSIRDKTTVYRQHGNGMVARLGSVLWRDNLLTRVYFNMVALNLSNYDLPPGFTSNWHATNAAIALQKGFLQYQKLLLKTIKNGVCRQLVVGHRIALDVIRLYKSYCDYIVIESKWSFVQRGEGLLVSITEFVKVLFPDFARKLWRRLMHHGEYAR